jgi:hypothetical protein
MPTVSTPTETLAVIDSTLAPAAGLLRPEAEQSRQFGLKLDIHSRFMREFLHGGKAAAYRTVLSQIK